MDMLAYTSKSSIITRKDKIMKYHKYWDGMSNASRQHYRLVAFGGMLRADLSNISWCCRIEGLNEQILAAVKAGELR